MGTESHGGTGADQPAEQPGRPGEGDPTIERDPLVVEQPTRAYEQTDLPVVEQPTRAYEQPSPEEHPVGEPPAAGAPPVDRGARTEQFATLPAETWAAQPPPAGPGAPPAAGGPSRRRPGTAVVVAVAAVIVALVAVAALALSWLTRDDRAPTAATATTPTTAAPATAPSQTTPAPTTQAGQVAGTVQVVRSGFTQLPPEPDGDAEVSYAVVLRNPRSDQVAMNVRAVMTFTAANGAVVETKDEELDALLPGQTAAVADHTGARGARRMRVQVVVGGFAPARGLTGTLTASGARTSVVAGELTTTATVRSTLGQPLTGAEVTAVYYDRSGRVIGGQSDSVDVVPAGGTGPARLDTSTTLRGIARTEVYASPKDLVAGG